ncbi:ubiquitin-like-specific protease 1D isoform X1 [Tanacetum coccineum]
MNSSSVRRAFGGTGIFEIMKSTTQNLITLRASQRRSKNLEDIVPGENPSEIWMDKKWLESMKGIKLYHPSHTVSDSYIKVSVMECLKPKTEISTSILDFYIEFIKANQPGLMEHKICIFNPYFYPKLEMVVFVVVDDLGIICIPSKEVKFGSTNSQATEFVGAGTTSFRATLNIPTGFTLCLEIGCKWEAQA